MKTEDKEEGDIVGEVDATKGYSKKRFWRVMGIKSELAWAAWKQRGLKVTMVGTRAYVAGSDAVALIEKLAKESAGDVEKS